MNELVSQLKHYAEMRLELFRLKAAESLIEAVSKTAMRILFGALFLSTLLMAEVSLGLYLGDVLDNWALGFAWITGGNLAFLFVTYLFRRPISRHIQNELSSFVK
jgi:hypothetical protein